MAPQREELWSSPFSLENGGKSAHGARRGKMLVLAGGRPESALWPIICSRPVKKQGDFTNYTSPHRVVDRDV